MGRTKNGGSFSLFERLALSEKVNWLPYSYTPLANTTTSFGKKNSKQLTRRLEKAKESVSVAKNPSPDNPELIVIEAMINTAWIAFDTAIYVTTQLSENSQLYQNALQLSPKNPRVVLIKTMWDMDSACYLGNDMAPYGMDVMRSLELFANFKPEGQFYPDWGKDHGMALTEQCGKR